MSIEREIKKISDEIDKKHATREAINRILAMLYKNEVAGMTWDEARAYIDKDAALYCKGEMDTESTTDQVNMDHVTDYALYGELRRHQYSYPGLELCAWEMDGNTNFDEVRARMTRNMASTLGPGMQKLFDSTPRISDMIDDGVREMIAHPYRRWRAKVMPKRDEALTTPPSSIPKDIADECQRMGKRMESKMRNQSWAGARAWAENDMRRDLTWLPDELLNLIVTPEYLDLVVDYAKAGRPLTIAERSML